MLKAGHRVGIALMSSNLWPALPDQNRSTNTPLSVRARRSTLVLPVVGGKAAAVAAGL
ncbi:MAG TPA: hypothetical protein VEO00_13395 [Actinomycetota bacterium]|nr:hypothetical protein [Actinomycetota bacterium]